MSISEIIDFVQQDLTMSGALPKILPDNEIRRVIVDIGMKWFYQNYQYAVQKVYYLVKQEAFQSDPATNYKYVKLPCEIQNIIWVYPIRDTALFQLGISAPNLSVNLGVTNQPYLSSYTTTIGELGVYKVVIDYFADVLNQLSKQTLKFDYNFNTNRFHLLTGIDSTVNGPNGTNLILEAYCQIPAEDLYDNENFRRYATALSRRQLGRLLTRYDYQLPGGFQIRGDQILQEGDTEVKKVEDEIKGQSQSAFFFMVKR